MQQILSRLWRARRALVAYALLLLAGWTLGHAISEYAIPDVRPQNEPALNRMVNLALLVFVLAAAIPFVPGAEIGFAVLLLYGGQAAPVVYAGMVGALVLSFTGARMMPATWIAAALDWLGLSKSADFIRKLDKASPRERDGMMAEILPDRLAGLALGRRYLALALVLNLPGNSVLGGGGGIAFSAGLSGLYRTGPYILTVLLAVLPVPLVFLVL